VQSGQRTNHSYFVCDPVQNLASGFPIHNIDLIRIAAVSSLLCSQGGNTVLGGCLRSLAVSACDIVPTTLKIHFP